MNTATCIGRVGALAVTLGVGVAVAAAPQVAMAEVATPADSTALLVCGTTCPKWHDGDVEKIMSHFITPTHPRQTITPVAVTTPGEAWPITGLFRLVGSAVGDPSFFGPGGAAWPDEPLWKHSGLFDLTTDQSIRQGVGDLEQAMATRPNEHLVIYGYSQGAIVANVEKRKLAEQYPEGTAGAPDIDFVLGGDFNVPNGGLHARFPGFYIPVVDWTFDGPEPTNTQFHTDVIMRQYDGVDDFPLYPLNFVADLNALLGFLYVHSYPFDVSLPPDPTTSPAYQGTYGETSPGQGGTSYYFFPTQHLPLFGPLRTLGVPEPVIDVVEPFFRVLVELGYDRSIKPWEPTPARLIPTKFDPAKVATDLVDAIGEGVNNAAALIGAPAPLSTSAPVTRKAPADEAASMEAGRLVTRTNTTPQTHWSTQTEHLVSTEPTTENGQASAKTETSINAVTGTTGPDEEQASTKTAASINAVTSTTGPDEVPSGLTAADVSSAPDVASTSQRVKPTLRSVTARRLLRDSLGATEQPRRFPYRRNSPTTGTTAADRAMTEGSSSASSAPAASSSGSNSCPSDASGGDAGGSH